MSDLSAMVGVDNSTLTRNINILINRTFVKKKQSSSDKREQLVVLSSKGQKIAEKIDRDMESILNTFINDINEEQHQQFVDTIEKLNWKMSCYINDL